MSARDHATAPVARTLALGAAARRWRCGVHPAAAAGGSQTALAQVGRAFGPIDRDAITPGDVAILKFLAAAELVEDDLWQQYCELAVANRPYNKALRRDDRAPIPYRSPDNPDFGAVFPQLVEIIDRPTIPTRSVSDARVQGIAHSAAFHFAAIEQGGSSLYCSLIPKASSLDVVGILAAIGPTEVYHFSAFHKSLEGIFGLNTG